MTCFRLSTGEKLTDYCRRTGIKYQSVFRRVDKGWDLEKAVSTPFLPKNGTKYFIDGKPAKQVLTKNQYQLWLKQQHKKGL